MYEALVTIFGNTSTPALLYYGSMAFASVFFSGWFLKNKLAAMATENNKQMEEKMNLMSKRIEKLEEDTVRKEAYGNDMNAIYRQLIDIKTDIREGFKAQTDRIDTLFKSKTSV